MTTTRRHIIAAVLLGTGTATIADMRPPTVDDATTFIAAAVQRHHVAPAPRDDERRWQVSAEFSSCSVAKRTSHEVRVLGRWEPSERLARWQMDDTPAEDVRVTTETTAAGSTYVVTLPCEGDRPCVDHGALGRERAAYFRFTSEFMAQRVAAAFRYAGQLCANALEPERE